MTTSLPSSSAFRAIVCSITAAVMYGCFDASTAPIATGDLRVADARATATTDMSVTSATPDSATQDTTLDVAVNGSGFVAGTSATWALGGVADSTQVRTNRTTFVSSRQLIANITLSKTATVAKWDIVVSATGKKGGIGTEAFTVKPHTVTATWQLPLSSTGLGLRSDGAQSDGTFSNYADGVCSVSAVIFTTGSGDATVQTNKPTAKTRTCQRTMTLVYPVGDPAYPSGGTETMQVFINAHRISNDTALVAVGYANRVERGFAVNPTQKQRCDAWRWTDSNYAGDKVWVERISATRFHVYTKDRDPDPAVALANAQNNRAVCTTTLQVHHLSVDLYIEANEPVK
jgi:hypothetical protein